ncbi:hypothetical protein B0H14DRAFT_3032414 [Mycena olivaceomarginata]|nr:hypothetical protein B0H14DRAFT_3032414 [Mycena olivaceomarginata]
MWRARLYSLAGGGKHRRPRCDVELTLCGVERSLAPEPYPTLASVTISIPPRAVQISALPHYLARVTRAIWSCVSVSSLGAYRYALYLASLHSRPLPPPFIPISHRAPESKPRPASHDFSTSSAAALPARRISRTHATRRSWDDPFLFWTSRIACTSRIARISPLDLKRQISPRLRARTRVEPRRRKSSPPSYTYTYYILHGPTYGPHGLDSHGLSSPYFSITALHCIVLVVLTILSPVYICI